MFLFRVQAYLGQSYCVFFYGERGGGRVEGLGLRRVGGGDSSMVHPANSTYNQSKSNMILLAKVMGP